MALAYLALRSFRRRRYRVRRREQSTDFTDAELQKQTRLTRFQFNYLLDRIGPLIASGSNSSLTISADTKLMAVLQFLGTGEFQWSASKSFGFSQAKMSQFVGEVVTAINSLTPELIHILDEEKRIKMARDFEAETGLPDIIGCIDGTFINIQTPCEEGDAFVDRRGNHSITCHVVCDSNMWIWDVNARWPGSLVDQEVFEVSGLKSCFDSNEYGNYKLFGDRGYGLQRYLLTVYRNPVNDLQVKFNELLTHTRSVVDRCIGLIKGRWRVLDRLGGQLGYTPGKVCHMFMAACILHNICLLTENGLLAYGADVDGLMNQDPPEDLDAAKADKPEGLVERDDYLQRHEAAIMNWQPTLRERRARRDLRRQHQRQARVHIRRRRVPLQRSRVYLRWQNRRRR